MAKSSTYVLTQDEQQTLNIEAELRRRGYTGIVMVDFIPDLRHKRIYTALDEGELVMLVIVEDGDSKGMFTVSKYQMVSSFVLTT